MRFLIPALLFLLSTAACHNHGESASDLAQADEAVVAAADGQKVFGEVPTVAETTAMKAIFADPDAWMGKTVAIETEIADVCQKAGCWAVLSDGEHSMRVTIPKHDWALPKDSTGQKALFQGKVVKGKTSKKVIEHYAGESNKPEIMPETTQEVVLAMELSGARFK